MARAASGAAAAIAAAVLSPVPPAHAADPVDYKIEWMSQSDGGCVVRHTLKKVGVVF
ncbi:hypothetical protein [Actinomadura hibisca]|uniref:hypothetical protein n=1 Tax=Actinomadura hibisca TaxID=68565 RepID=UPI000A83BC39|nr:hypothetical protein [Actinomadura hibisca]